MDREGIDKELFIKAITATLDKEGCIIVKQ